MPKGRGANARRRTPRQHGHLNDERHQNRQASTIARGEMKLQRLYLVARKRFLQGHRP